MGLCFSSFQCNILEECKTAETRVPRPALFSLCSATSISFVPQNENNGAGASSLLLVHLHALNASKQRRGVRSNIKRLWCTRIMGGRRNSIKGRQLLSSRTSYPVELEIFTGDPMVPAAYRACIFPEKIEFKHVHLSLRREHDRIVGFVRHTVELKLNGGNSRRFIRFIADEYKCSRREESSRDY